MCFSKNALQRDDDSCKLRAKDCFVFSQTFPLCLSIFYVFLVLSPAPYPKLSPTPKLAPIKA